MTSVSFPSESVRTVEGAQAQGEDLGEGCSQPGGGGGGGEEGEGGGFK